MTPLSDVIRAYAQDNHLACTEGSSPEKPSVLLHSFPGRGNCCLMWVTIAVHEDERQIDIIVTGSPKAFIVRKPQVSRFLDLANEEDTFGRFAIDEETGGVLYATTASAADIGLDAEALAFAVRVAATRYDRLYPCLVQVIGAAADQDWLWRVTEKPDWGRINQEYNSLKCRPSWMPPVDTPALEGVLRLPR